MFSRTVFRTWVSAFCMGLIALTLVVETHSVGRIAKAQATTPQPCTTPADVACVGLDDIGSAVASGATTISWTNQTVDPNGINRAMVVAFSYRIANTPCAGEPTGQILSPVGDTVTWSTPAPSSQSFTRLATQINTVSNMREEVWILLDPAPASLTSPPDLNSSEGTVQVTLTGACPEDHGTANTADIRCASFSATGVDTTSIAVASPGSTISKENNTQAGGFLLGQGPGRLICSFAAVPSNLNLVPQTTGIATGETPQFSTDTATNPLTTLASAAATRRGDSGFSAILFDIRAAGNPPASQPLTSASWLLAYVNLVPRVLTSVAFRDSEVKAFTNGSLIRWHTAFESSNLGFDLYRERSGVRERITSDVIAGSSLFAKSTLPVGYSYTWWDRDGKPGDHYWIEDVDQSGTRSLHGPIVAEGASGTSPVPSVSTTLGKLTASQPSSQSFPLLLANNPTPQLTTENGLQKQGAPNRPGTTQWAIAGQPALRLAVSEAGWYRVSAQDIASAGIDSSKIDPRTLRLFADGTELPLSVSGESDGRLDPGDYIEFFGSGVDINSTNTRVYYLTFGSGNGIRIKSVPVPTADGVGSSFPMTVQLKERLVYFAGLNNGDSENFFGRVIASQPVDQTLSLAHVDSVQATAKVNIALQGASLAPHTVGVSINGHNAGTIAFVNKDHQVATFAVPQSYLVEGTNTVTLTRLGTGSDVSLVDYINVTYTHAALADDDQVYARGNGRQSLSIGGFRTPQVRAVDVTNPSAVREFSTRVVVSPTGYTASVQGTGAINRVLYFFTPDQIRRPDSISFNAPSRWNVASNAADLVIVSNRLFIPALAPLVAFRQSQGYRVSVVDIDDVYDEFGFGYHSPFAIKAFLARAYSSWQVAPKAVLLVGDASLDPRNYFGLGELDFVPTRLIDTAELEVASDDLLGDFDGDSVPEMAVGRFPVRTMDDVSAVVSKTIGYENGSASGRKALLVTDANTGEDFAAATASVHTLLPGDYSVTEVSRESASDQVIHGQIIDAINSGPGIVNYFGHGSTDLWRGNILLASDADGLTNFTAPSNFVIANCLNGYFQEPLAPSLGEALLLSRNGGAVTVWASSGITTAASQPPMISEFYRQLFGSPTVTIGEAARRAKLAASVDVRRTWVLLGDPLTRLR